MVLDHGKVYHISRSLRHDFGYLFVGIFGCFWISSCCFESPYTLRKDGCIKIDEDEQKIKVDIKSRTKLHEFHDNSIPDDREISDAYTQVFHHQSLETFIQSSEIIRKISTQMEQIQFNTASTQTLSEIKLDKQIQTFLQVFKNKETETSPNLFSDKENENEAIPNSTKVFVSMKRQKSKPTIPKTKEFLNYHQREYDVQRRKIKFKLK
ncbi:hypothetical protein AVEN_176316-1 [Araneus ventricosus]|uniref:Uncharacterized protein n=1 Tax=Araneus ventricosus TaxID=182803 RepID=A0A4Y2UZX3_ARAVE|nr:hypothetical protein AVEN_269911-1 [Araneus ventricosus]GBO26011.1 hypothetical protein AVEN_176316-1 [Araneus ventricosus]